MVNKESFNLIRLIRSKNVGIKTFNKLLNIFGSTEKALLNLTKYSKNFQYPLIPCSIEEIEKEIENCTKIGAEIITIKDDCYPYLLKQINNPPPVLTILGNKNLLNSNIVAIVGARNASANGYNFAGKLGEELGEEGFTIVSGLARGIDTAAHKNSVETGTIAVMANGINTVYPKENEGLYYEIAKKGLLVSELPFGTAPRGQYFPARNRIVSGLSKGVIVVEASSKSGTLITANRAIEQGREVFVVPGNPYDPRYDGSNALLKDGATLLIDSRDVVSSLENFKMPVNLKEYNIKECGIIEDDTDDLFKKEEIEINKEIKEPGNLKELIFSKLNNIPIEIELLSEQLDINTRELGILLSELELDGKVVVEYGKARLIEK